MLQNVNLVKKEMVAKDTMALYFGKPKSFTFRAGQVCNITLINPPEADKEGNTRCFSFMTAPYASDVGVATRLRDTAFKRVFCNLPIGAEVKFDAPYGDFTLHKTESTPAVFIIGGIGITPVRSMIAQATRDKTLHKITLLHANRTPADAPFQADFIRFANENHNFTFVPVVTDSAPNDWQGERGRVNADMLKKHIPNLNAPIYYLSGPEGMVKAMRQLLVGNGVNEDSIRTEEFAGY